jgi:putative MFS transporter
MSITWAMAFFGLVAWLPSILMRMGFTQVHSFAYTAAIVGAGATGNFLSGWCMDFLGRRLITSACFFLGGLSMIAWGFATTSGGILLFGMLTAFFGPGGVAGCMFTYICEIYPTQFRATGAGLGTAWQRIGGIIAPTVLGLVIGAHGPIFDSFLVLGIILLIGGLAAMTLMYETKGKTLEQITAHLAS